MKKHLRRAWLVATVACIAVGILVSVGHVQAAEKVITLHYSNFLPATHKNSLLIDQWCREVEKRSGGRVKVVHYPGGTLTPPAQTYDSVMQGIADIGLAVPGYTRGRFPLTEVIDLPLGIKTSLTGTKMANEFYKKFRPKELDGVKLLYFYVTGPGLLHTRKPVNKLEDLKGMKIRTQGNIAKVMTALGGTPVAMPMSETYDALQKGVTDGVLAPYESLEGWRLGEVTKYSIENYGSSYEASFFTIMNKDKFNSLPKDIQTIIEKVSEEYIEKMGRLWDEVDASGKKFVQSRGNKIITLSPAEDQRWAKQLDVLREEYVKMAKSKGLPGDQALQFCLDYIKSQQK